MRVTTKVKLRFAPSKRDGSLISFVSVHPVTQAIRCVREDDKFQKSIVLLPKDVESEVIRGVQYEATITPMKNGARGYVATELTPVTYEASMEVIYVKKALYQIKITWGNQTVMFDPFDGRIKSVRDHKLVADYLRKRVDISGSHEFAQKFYSEAVKIVRHMELDGCDLFKFMKR